MQQSIKSERLKMNVKHVQEAYPTKLLLLQHVGIELVTFVVDFIHLAVEFITLAVEFVPF